MGRSRSVRSPDAALAHAEGLQRDAEGVRHDAQRFHDAEDARGGDGADADEAHVAAEDLRRRHLRDRNGARIDRRGVVAADHPDQRHQHQVGEHAAGAENHRTAQSHHVAQAEDEADGVEAQRDAGLVGERADDGHELEIEILLPDVEGGDQKIVDARNRGGLQQQFRLRAALLAGDQDLGDGGGLGVGKDAVHVAHEVAAQRNQEEDAQAAAGHADEDGLHRVRIELQDVERGQREDGARDHRSRQPADAGDDHVFQQCAAPRIDAREADRQDGDRDRGLHHLPHLQPGVGGGDGEDDAQKDAPSHRARRQFGELLRCRHRRLVDRPGRERGVGIGG